MNQHMPLYRDGRHYDAMNQDIVADIPFYVDEAKRANGPVLELACGTGRLSIPIAQSGVEIVGLDLVPSMLAHARSKAKQAGTAITFIQGDCRSFALQRKFALILMGFNSMQHIHDHDSLVAMFACIRQHLAAGGRFVFDVFNPKLSLLARRPDERKHERDYEDPDCKGMISFAHAVRYDDASQVAHIQCYFTRCTNGEERDFRMEELKMRCFFPQELDLLVRSQGFEVIEKFGNFERKSFASGDAKQVTVCTLGSRLQLFTDCS